MYLIQCLLHMSNNCFERHAWSLSKQTVSDLNNVKAIRICIEAFVDNAVRPSFDPQILILWILPKHLSFLE